MGLLLIVHGGMSAGLLIENCSVAQSLWLMIRMVIVWVSYLVAILA